MPILANLHLEYTMSQVIYNNKAYFAKVRGLVLRIESSTIHIPMNSNSNDDFGPIGNPMTNWMSD